MARRGFIGRVLRKDGRSASGEPPARATDSAARGDHMPTLPSLSPTTEVPASDPAEAQRHFARLLQLETDCWDVHASLERGAPGFVLLDVRSPQHFRRGHVQGAVNLPHGRLSSRALEELPAEKLFVVYCSGPPCNGE